MHEQVETSACLYSRSGDCRLQNLGVSSAELLIWISSSLLCSILNILLCQKEGTNVDVISLEHAYDWSSSSNYIWHWKMHCWEKFLRYSIPSEHCWRLRCPYRPAWLFNPSFDLPLVLWCQIWIQKRVPALSCQRHASRNGSEELKLSRHIATA